VTPHAAWLALDVDPASRGALRSLVSEGTDAVETKEIRVHLMQGRGYGSQRFRRHKALAGRCTEVRPCERRCLIQSEIEPGTFQGAKNVIARAEQFIGYDTTRLPMLRLEVDP
jgi:hypothetical protein